MHHENFLLRDAFRILPGRYLYVPTLFSIMTREDTKGAKILVLPFIPLGYTSWLGGALFWNQG